MITLASMGSNSNGQTVLPLRPRRLFHHFFFSVSEDDETFLCIIGVPGETGELAR